MVEIIQVVIEAEEEDKIRKKIKRETENEWNVYLMIMIRYWDSLVHLYTFEMNLDIKAFHSREICTILRENLNNRSCEWNKNHQQKLNRESEEDERRNLHEYRAENQTHTRNKWEKNY